jgi:hypothetical protein
MRQFLYTSSYCLEENMASLSYIIGRFISTLFFLSRSNTSRRGQYYKYLPTMYVDTCLDLRLGESLQFV